VTIHSDRLGEAEAGLIVETVAADRGDLRDIGIAARRVDRDRVRSGGWNFLTTYRNDRAAAAILVSVDKLKQLAGGRKRAKVAASVLISDPWTDRDLTLPDVSTLTWRASKQAYEKAGIGPKDIALSKLHDCFATAEPVHCENLGLCGDGEAGRFIDSGGGVHPSLGGHDPVTVSGVCSARGILLAPPESRISTRWSGI
jgi:acetyl-CoA acetyltransferase